VNDKGEFGEGWLDRLGDEFKDGKQILSRFKTLPEALKSLVSSQKLLGKKSDAVVIPGADATPEEKADFLKRLGRPDSPDAYPTKPKELPEGFQWDESIAKDFNKLAHEAGILPHQMEAIIEKYAEIEINRTKEAAEKAVQEFQAGKKALAEAWGDKVETNTQTAIRMAKTVGLDLNTPGLSDPNVVKALERAASMVSDSTLVPMDSVATSQPGKMRANDIITNPANPQYAAYQGKQGVEAQQKARDLILDLLKNG
jgi:hypothetical protein